jgi:hypothetical protein
MFVQSKTTTLHQHKDGICLSQRRGGRETLVQWSNGDQRWHQSLDLDGKIQIVIQEVQDVEA